MPGFSFDTATRSSTVLALRSEFTTSTWIRWNRLTIGVELFRLERQVLEQELVVDHRIGIDDADGVAVGRRILAGARGDIAGAAGLVLDHQRLAEALAQRVVEHAHEDVADAAGARGGEDVDRPVGIDRRPGRRAAGQQGQK